MSKRIHSHLEQVPQQAGVGHAFVFGQGFHRHVFLGSEAGLDLDVTGHGSGHSCSEGGQPCPTTIDDLTQRLNGRAGHERRYSVTDLNKAIAAFLICFGSTLPAPLRQTIQDRMNSMAEQIDHGGEPTVAKLTKGFADALGAMQPPAIH